MTKGEARNKGAPAKANGTQKGPQQEPQKPQNRKPAQKELPRYVRTDLIEVARTHPTTVVGRFWRWSGKSAAWASALITMLGALFFLPRVSVDSSGPYDPANPTPISFVVTNTNIVPLRNVDLGVGLGFLEFSELNGKEPQYNGPAGSKLMFTPWHTEWLLPDEKHQIFLEEAFLVAKTPNNKSELNANITIIITFNPWYGFWKSEKQFRFVTRKLADGKTYWVAMPLYK